MKKDKLYTWCDQMWLQVLYAIGVIMSCWLVAQWNDLSAPSKMMGLLTVLVPLHVFEENTFPGGFFFMNNLGQRSAQPLVYPQNMLTNMITNMGAELLFIVIFFFADAIPCTVAVVVMVFGYAECVHHTISGVQMQKKYAAKGKRTIYGPGTITCFVGLIQLSTYALVWLCGHDVSVGDVLGGIGIVLFVAVGLILLPFQVSKRLQSQRFAFSSNGYFEKYDPVKK